MIDLRPVIYVLGIFLITLAIAMSVPIAFDLKAHNPDWQAFLFSMAVSGFFGVLLTLTNRPAQDAGLSPKQAFLLTSLSWIVLAGFAAVPFCASSLQMTFTDAYFEAMSGLTTTGSTVIVGLDHAPPGILMWRGMLNGLGGAGIIVMALSILPMLRVGGMQLFKSEASERDKHMPSVRAISRAFVKTYVGLVIACTVGYMWTGMTFFDALANAMPTIATGGFATTDSSFGNRNISTQYVAIVFMILSAVPLLLLAKAFAGSPGPLFRDQQVRGFLLLLAAAMAAMVLYAWMHVGLPLEQGFREGVFAAGYAHHHDRLRQCGLLDLGAVRGLPCLLPDLGRRLRRIDQRRPQVLPL
jgi:trk system potassium uptake protein TrkH